MTRGGGGGGRGGSGPRDKGKATYVAPKEVARHAYTNPNRAFRIYDTAAEQQQQEQQQQEHQRRSKRREDERAGHQATHQRVHAVVASPAESAAVAAPTPHAGGGGGGGGGDGADGGAGGGADGRLFVWIRDRVHLEPSGDASRKCTYVFKTKSYVQGWRWKELTPSAVDFYWSEFKKHVRWDQYEDEKVVRAAWEKKARTRYADYLGDLRKPSKKDGEVHRPIHVTEDIWKEWMAKWSTPEFRALGQKASACRRTPGAEGAGPVTHTAGSRSTYSHSRALAERLGREPFESEIFKETHKRKQTDEWVDERARAVGTAIEEQYSQRLSQAQQDLSSQSSTGPGQLSDELCREISRKAYLDVVPPKKSRVYGLGSTATSSFPQHTGLSGRDRTPVRPPGGYLSPQEVEARIQQSRAEIEATMEAKMEEKVRSMVAAMMAEIRAKEDEDADGDDEEEGDEEEGDEDGDEGGNEGGDEGWSSSDDGGGR